MYKEHVIEDFPVYIDNFLLPIFWHYTKNSQYDSACSDI